MIIGIDGNEANVKKRVGIGQYAYQVLMHINRIQNSEFRNQNDDVKFLIYLKDKPLDDFPPESERWSYVVIGPSPMWTHFALPLRLLFSRNKPNVFFSPSHYAPRMTTIAQYISIMDMSFIRYPQLFTTKDRLQLTNWTAYSVRKARKIFTISEFSKKEIVEIYNLPENKVVVTYPGYDDKSFVIGHSSLEGKERKILSVKYGIRDNYLLFVGTLQPRKNVVGLINAYNNIIQKYKSRALYLVIIGKKGWQYEEIFYTINKLGIEEKVRIMEFIADGDLPIFYRNANCFVLPSFYEGFGLPVIEAMACGCPTIVSNVSSLPEITKSASYYVDPNDTEKISCAIEKILTYNKLRNDLIKKGLERVKYFSWQRCAQKTLATLI